MRLDLRYALFPLVEDERIFTHLPAAETLDDPHRLGRIAGYMSNHFIMKGEFDQAIVSAHRALALATSHKDFDGQVGANQMLGLIYFHLGDYRQALEV